METFSALLSLCAGNSPVTGEFPTLRPVTRSFGVSFDLHPNKRLSNVDVNVVFYQLCLTQDHSGIRDANGGSS